MSQIVQFPPEALLDVRALVILSEGQLDRLAKLLDCREATPPIDQAFEDRVAQALRVGAEIAGMVVRISLIIQLYDLDEESARLVTHDFEELVRTQHPEDEQELLVAIEAKRDALINVLCRKPKIAREFRRREVTSGSQPAIDAIRTLVELRPLFRRDESDVPVDIECLIPAMTLELKYEHDDRDRSMTFSLSEETLDELLQSLQDARAKWTLLNTKYSGQICE